jgi:hypothetical protein
MDFLTLLLALLLVWVLVGQALFWWGVRAPAPRARALARTADHRILLVGERLSVALHAAAHGIPSPAKREPWDIVLLVDHSASMGAGRGSALETAKRAMINLARTLPANFRLAVVEFDERGRVLHPLNERRDSLIDAVRRMAGGGGTDIAAGLETARGLFPEIEETERDARRALILLSDGGSEAESALEQAARIKRRGVALITLGLGEADANLLEGLASGPDLYFHARDIKRLQALYREIGERMAGGALGAVEIVESLRASTWRIRAFDELVPADRAPEGRIHWLLGSLDREGMRLTYQVETDCPGWFRIGAAPATLNARQENGQEYEARSNLGPWVLVLPRSVAWRVWSLILNPLFFLLFGRFLCHPAPCETRAASAPACPRPSAPPPPLPPLEDDEVRLDIPPTLAIGLGYAGVQALTHCKRLLWERDEPAHFERAGFLAIDTAAPHYCPSPKFGVVTLASDERLTLSAPLEPVIAAEARAAVPTYPWLPAQALLGGGARPDLQRGMGQQRALGRLALLRNLATVEKALRDRLAALAQRNGAGALQVLLCCATGGGGGGMLIDLCWLARRALDELGCADASISLFLMPPFGTDRTGWDSKEAQEQRDCNHEALMAELERIVALKGDPYAPAPDLPEARRLADRVFFVGPAARREMDANREIHPRGGEILFAWLASKDLRAHFQQRAVIPGKANAARIETASAYLYPRTMRTRLSLETLLHLLSRRFFAGDPDGMALTEDLTRSGQIALDALLVRDRAPLPWSLANLETLRSPERMKRMLNLCGGPICAYGLDELALESFMEEQGRLTLAHLRARVCDALNDIGLSAVYQALVSMRARLDEAADALTENRSRQTSEIREDETIQDLLTLTRRAVAQWIGHLAAWGQLWGHGCPGELGGGVMARMRRETEELRFAIEEARAYASPRMALDDARIEELRRAEFDMDDAWLGQRLAWAPASEGSRPNLALTVHADRLCRFELGAASAETIVSALLEIARRRSAGLRTPRVETFLPERWNYSVDPPLSDTDAYYLCQGKAIPPTAHVQIQEWKTMDPAERRLYAVNHDVPLHRVWDIPSCTRLAPPHALTEEYHAYRIHYAHCRSQNRIPGRLDPRVVALFRAPERLRRIIAEGLVGGGIVLANRQGRSVWTFDNKTLSVAKENPVETFFEAMRAALSIDAPANAPPPPTDTGFEEARQRILQHPLLAAMGMDENVAESFADLAKGLLKDRKVEFIDSVGDVGNHDFASISTHSYIDD